MFGSSGPTSASPAFQEKGPKMMSMRTGETSSARGMSPVCGRLSLMVPPCNKQKRMAARRSFCCSVFSRRNSVHFLSPDFFCCGSFFARGMSVSMCAPISGRGRAGSRSRRKWLAPVLCREAGRCEKRETEKCDTRPARAIARHAGGVGSCASLGRQPLALMCACLDIFTTRLGFSGAEISRPCF